MDKERGLKSSEVSPLGTYVLPLPMLINNADRLSLFPRTWLFDSPRRIVDSTQGRPLHSSMSKSARATHHRPQETHRLHSSRPSLLLRQRISFSQNLHWTTHPPPSGRCHAFATMNGAVPIPRRTGELPFLQVIL